MNKVLVLVYIPLLEEEYDIFIPINKKIGTVKKIIIDTISELSGGNLNTADEYKLYDRENGQIYDNNIFVKESPIINGTRMMLL